MVVKGTLKALGCSAQITKWGRRKRGEQNVDNRALNELKRERMGKKERVMGWIK
jgi:hypothetical protein